MRPNSRLKISKGPCWTSILSRIRPQGPHASWTLMPQMSQSERYSVRWSMESRSQSPTSPAFSTAHKETTAPRGESSLQSSHLSNTSDTTSWATKLSFEQTITAPWLRTFKRPEGILARWIETLAEFDFEIEHRAGRLHSNADAISRQNCKQCWGKVVSDNWIDECERADQLVEPLSLHTIQLRCSEFSDDAIAELQAEDSEIGKAY